MTSGLTEKIKALETDDRYDERVRSHPISDNYIIQSKNSRIMYNYFKVRGYRNLWEIEEFDKERGSRISILSSNCTEPLNEVRFKENK
jgi:hypothetical protein